MNRIRELEMEVLEKSSGPCFGISESYHRIFTRKINEHLSTCSDDIKNSQKLVGIIVQSDQDVNYEKYRKIANHLGLFCFANYAVMVNTEQYIPEEDRCPHWVQHKVNARLSSAERETTTSVHRDSDLICYEVSVDQDVKIISMFCIPYISGVVPHYPEEGRVSPDSTSDL